MEVKKQMTTDEQIHRLDKDIERLKEKVKIYQGKISQLVERRKKLEGRALLETINGIAPDYQQAQRLLSKLKAEQQSGQREDGGAGHGSSSSEQPRDG